MSDRAPPKRTDGPAGHDDYRLGRMLREVARLSERVERLEDAAGRVPRLLEALPPMRERAASHQDFVDLAEEITGRHENMNSERVRKAIKAEANAVIAGSVMKSVGVFIAAILGVIAVYLFGRFTK